MTPFWTHNPDVEFVYSLKDIGVCILCGRQSYALFQFQWNQFMDEPCYEFALACQHPLPLPEPQKVIVEDKNWGFVFNPWGQVVAMAA